MYFVFQLWFTCEITSKLWFLFGLMQMKRMEINENAKMFKN